MRRKWERGPAACLWMVACACAGHPLNQGARRQKERVNEEQLPNCHRTTYYYYYYYYHHFFCIPLRMRCIRNVYSVFGMGEGQSVRRTGESKPTDKQTPRTRNWLKPKRVEIWWECGREKLIVNVEMPLKMLNCWIRNESLHSTNITNTINSNKKKWKIARTACRHQVYPKWKWKHLYSTFGAELLSAFQLGFNNFPATEQLWIGD